jgi:DNA invertase Pin-like site-specific DNA recombinase
MTTRIYVRASTKEQNATRALSDLQAFATHLGGDYVAYIENFSGTKLNRPELNRLLDEAVSGDVLLVESVDRLSRLSQDDFKTLKDKIADKGLRLIVADLPTTHHHHQASDTITTEILSLINNMLIDLLATMARLDNDKRRERIIQGMKNKGYIPKGKQPNQQKHQLIQSYLNRGLTNKEIAKLADSSVATVSRVKKQYLNQGLTTP